MTTSEQTTPDLDRAAVYQEIAALAETLPAPEGIRFATAYPTQLYIDLDSVPALTAWATALGANDWAARGVRHKTTEQWRVYGRWHGYYVTVAHIRVIADEQAGA